MISAKQVKSILDYSFVGGSSFLAPVASFIATPSSYTDTTVPGGIVLSGNIIPNDGTDVSWTITDAVATVLTSGTTTSVSHNLVTIPSSIGSYTYNLNVAYKDLTGTTFSTTVVTQIVVSTACKIGQLPNPGDDIIVPGDLDPLVEDTFAIKTQAEVINLFTITAAATGRVVIIIPDSFGSVVDIQDNTDSSVLSQFDIVLDPTNTRKLYVSVNAVTPATYHYKIVF